MSALTDTLRRLEAVVGEDHLLTATQAVGEYAMEGQTPLAVAFPGSAEQAAALLRATSEAGLSVLVRGAGGHLYLGNPPSPIGLVVCMGRLNRIVEYDPDDLTITAEAGISLEDLQRAVSPRGQMLPLDPPGPPTATLGGIVAANLSGPMRMRHGAPRDLVLGLRAALTSGEVIHTGGKTVKNVAGYDLTKLFVGSFGTIGAITEVTVRLVPAPEVTALLTAVLPASGVADALAAVVASPLEIAACELVNSAAAARLGRRLPGVVPAGSHLLVLGLAGPREAVVHQAQTLEAMLAVSSARIEGEQEADAWANLRALSYPSAPGATLLRMSVPISSVAETMALISAQRGCSAVAQAAAGVIHVSTDKPSDLQQAKQSLAMLRSAAEGVGGFAVLASGSVPLKREFDVWGKPAPNRDLMQGLKRAYDRRDTLGCGRFVC